MRGGNFLVYKESSRLEEALQSETVKALFEKEGVNFIIKIEGQPEEIRCAGVATALNSAGLRRTVQCLALSSLKSQRGGDESTTFRYMSGKPTSVTVNGMPLKRCLYDLDMGVNIEDMEFFSECGVVLDTYEEDDIQQESKYFRCSCNRLGEIMDNIAATGIYMPEIPDDRIHFTKFDLYYHFMPDKFTETQGNVFRNLHPKEVRALEFLIVAIVKYGPEKTCPNPRWFNATYKELKTIIVNDDSNITRTKIPHRIFRSEEFFKQYPQQDESSLEDLLYNLLYKTKVFEGLHETERRVLQAVLKYPTDWSKITSSGFSEAVEIYKIEEPLAARAEYARLRC